ncbi:guanylate-binding protein 6-like isoform X1 [Eumetopias jubatus]|uniref:guanylate-binding protein 6-like isoform X1 n=1 Tax=Eumetopias jubatus TaxID=34886 RepID=UPI001016E383|nr:guanylate-binding protein 6-like isoform X1 [Eumetopias jubatus]
MRKQNKGELGDNWKLILEQTSSAVEQHLYLGIQTFFYFLSLDPLHSPTAAPSSPLPISTTPGLGILTVTFTDTFHSGAVPCLDDVVIPLSWCEDSAALQREIPTEMVLALPHLDPGVAHTMQPSQDDEFQKQYLDLLQMKNELEETCKKKDELLRDAQRALAEEQDKRETVEREKQLLEKNCEDLQQKLMLLEITLKETRIQLKKERKEREDLQREQDERIRRLEAQMNIITANKQNAKNYCISKTTANDSEEYSSETSWWSKICKLIQEMYFLITKFFCCG